MSLSLLHLTLLGKKDWISVGDHLDRGDIRTNGKENTDFVEGKGTSMDT